MARFTEADTRFVTWLAQLRGPGSRLASRYQLPTSDEDRPLIQVAPTHGRNGDSPAPVPENRDLRWIASAFESAQALRLRTAEQIRAVASERPERTPGGHLASDPEALLARIRSGGVLGPAPSLGETYRRSWNEERHLLRLLTTEVGRHPAWPWLERVRGVGPSLAARLLARLDIERAPTPSSFWSYCGLATVAAEMYRCDQCGYELSLPAGRPLRAGHRVPGTGQACSGSLARASDGPRRVAQPRPSRGESAPYDREAKKLCYLIGISFIRQGEAYRRYYTEQRNRLDSTKPDWIPRRRHLTALRMTEKLFLAHLWLVWRESLGLPITAPYGDPSNEGGSTPRPWSMVD